jgi:hypothetical protein
MSAKCAMCKKAIVSQKGQICITCQINQRAYAAAPVPMPENQPVQKIKPAGDVLNTNPVTTYHGNNQVYGIYRGTVHNYHQSEVKRSVIWKLWNSCINGVSFSTSDIQYEFTLYEKADRGLSGHEVVLYGDAGFSPLSDNSEVIVKGKLNRNGIIVASEISGVNTGFRMYPRNSIKASIIRIALAFLLVLIAVAGLGGISAMNNSVNTMQSGDASVSRVLIFIIAVLMTMIILKTRTKKKYLYAMLPVFFALGMYNDVFLILFVCALILVILLKKIK